jgi:hypothetical protein
VSRFRSDTGQAKPFLLFLLAMVLLLLAVAGPSVFEYFHGK